MNEPPPDLPSRTIQAKICFFCRNDNQQALKIRFYYQWHYLTDRVNEI